MPAISSAGDNDYNIKHRDILGDVMTIKLSNYYNNLVLNLKLLSWLMVAYTIFQALLMTQFPSIITQGSSKVLQFHFSGLPGAVLHYWPQVAYYPVMN